MSVVCQDRLRLRKQERFPSVSCRSILAKEKTHANVMSDARSVCTSATPRHAPHATEVEAIDNRKPRPSNTRGCMCRKQRRSLNLCPEPVLANRSLSMPRKLRRRRRSVVPAPVKGAIAIIAEEVATRYFGFTPCAKQRNGHGYPPLQHQACLDK